MKLPGKLVENPGQLRGESEPLRDHPELLVGIEVRLGRDHSQNGFGQTEVGEQRQVAFLPRLDVVEFVRVDVCLLYTSDAADE